MFQAAGVEATFTAYSSCKSKFAKGHIHNPNPNINPTLLSFTAFFVMQYCSHILAKWSAHQRLAMDVLVQVPF